MSIEIFDDNPVRLFLQGEVVFKISATSSDGSSRDVHMVVSKDDYDKKLESHQYTPLLFAVDLYRRLAYLYDCLNRQPNQSRDEQFMFLWRRLGQTEWNKWFEVSPYIENHVIGITNDE